MPKVYMAIDMVVAEQALRGLSGTYFVSQPRMLTALPPRNMHFYPTDTAENPGRWLVVKK
jgi:hypothetical protein